MPQATWHSYNHGRIDGINPTTSVNAVEVGTFSFGGSKAARLRGIVLFDLTQPPQSGLAPGAGDEIVAADLSIYIDTVSGPGAWPGTIERITRADVSGYPQTTWNNYKTASAWTAAGGDVDTTDAVPFTSPTANGLWTVPGLLALAVDALRNRAGLLLLRLRKNSEANEIAEFGNTQLIHLGGTLTLTTGAAHTVDEPDPRSANIGAGVSASAPAPPARAGRASQGARPARPHRGRMSSKNGFVNRR